jgi:hypothetical protein
VTAKLRRRVVTVPRLERELPPIAAAEPAPPAPPAPTTPPTPIEDPPPAPREPVVSLGPTPAVVRSAASPRSGAPPPRGTWTATRTLAAAIAIAGVGVAGGGVYFGVHAAELERRADARCPLSTCADPLGLRFNEQAQEAARRANMLYIAGGASVALATVLWLVGGPGEQTVVTPVIGDRQAGVALGGRF